MDSPLRRLDKKRCLERILDPVHLRNRTCFFPAKRLQKGGGEQSAKCKCAVARYHSRATATPGTHHAFFVFKTELALSTTEDQLQKVIVQYLRTVACSYHARRKGKDEDDREAVYRALINMDRRLREEFEVECSDDSQSQLVSSLQPLPGLISDRPSLVDEQSSMSSLLTSTSTSYSITGQDVQDSSFMGIATSAQTEQGFVDEYAILDRTIRDELNAEYGDDESPMQTLPSSLQPLPELVSNSPSLVDKQSSMSSPPTSGSMSYPITEQEMQGCSFGSIATSTQHGSGVLNEYAYLTSAANVSSAPSPYNMHFQDHELLFDFSLAAGVQPQVEDSQAVTSGIGNVSDQDFDHELSFNDPQHRQQDETPALAHIPLQAETLHTPPPLALIAISSSCCGLDFSTWDTINEHIATWHGPLDSLSCCQQSFTNLASLKKHVDDVH